MSKTWNGSSVMMEFQKIAEDAGLITTKLHPDKKDVVGNPNKKPKEYTRMEPTEDYAASKCDLVQKAHPGKKYVAHSQGDGALVETINQQHATMVDIARKNPHGALIGVHANLINTLIKVANELDEKGNYKKAKEVDDLLQKLTNFPFSQRHLSKRAWVGAVIGIAGLLAAFAPSLFQYKKTLINRKGPHRGTAKMVDLKHGPKRLIRGAGVAATALGILNLFGQHFLALQDGIIEDTNDLLSALKDKINSTDGDVQKLSKQLIEILEPFQMEFKTVNLEQKDSIMDIKNIIDKLNLEFPEIQKLMEELIKQENEFFPMLHAKYNKFQKSLDEINKKIEEMVDVAEKGDIGAQVALQEMTNFESQLPENDTKALQTILFEIGFPKGNVYQGQVTGIMDNNTIEATRKLEEKLDEVFKKYNDEKNLTGSFKNKIIDNSNISINIDILEHVMQLAEKLKLV